MHVMLSAPTAGPATTTSRQASWQGPSNCQPQRRLSACPAAAHGGVETPATVGRHRRRAVAARAAAGQQQQQTKLEASAAAGGDDDAEQLVEEEAEEWVEVGKIGPPHGVRGEMKVQPLTDFPEDRLGTPGPRWLLAPEPKIGRQLTASPVEIELEWGRSMISKGNELWLVKLAAVESPEEAALLRGHTLLIPASAREPLEDEDEFYVQDLVGLSVFLQATGEEVGHVSDVFDGTGTHDLLRIQLAASQLERLAALAALSSSRDDEGSNEQEGEAGGGFASQPRHVLLPFAKAMVPVVDLAAGRMEVTPPEGLLELVAPSSMRRRRKEIRGRRERRRPRPRWQPSVAAAPGSDASSTGMSKEE